MAAEPSEWQRVADAGALELSDGRLHLQLEGRYISILQHQGQLYCLDSVCFHAGGPLTLGEIEELNNTPCIVCPWHYYHISLKDGEKWYQGTTPDSTGKLQAGPWKSVGRRQRVHEVELRPDGIYVRLNREGAMASDEYACKHECGDRVKNGRIRLSPKHVHEGGSGGQGPYSPKASPPSSPRHPSEGEDVWPDDLDPAVVQQQVLQARRRSSGGPGAPS